MGRAIYTKEHHEKAYKIWWDTRTYSRVAESLGVGADTVKAWSRADFGCVDGCPWHNWDRLVQEQQAALDERVRLYQEGVIDPIQHSDAVTKAVPVGVDAPGGIVGRRKVVEELVRSDLEVIGHLELLYGKLYYQMMGLVLDHRDLIDKHGTRTTTRQVYEQGLKVVSMEGGVRSLFAVRDRIDKLMERMGIHKKTPDEHAIQEEQSKQPLTIEELRKIQEVLQNTPPEHLEILKKMMKAEDAAVQSLSEPQKLE